MKLIIAFCLVFLNSVFLFSQDQTPVSIQKEFGLDATFINRFLPFDNEVGITNDYLFSYRFTKLDGRFTRLGFNIDFAFDNQDNENERTQNSSRIGLGFRAGGGKSKSIYKNLTLFTGFDWTGGFSYESTKIGESGPGNRDDNRSSSTIVETGLGPFIGLQYNINDKFGIYTEADFYANFSYQADFFKSLNQPRLDRTDNKVSFADKIALPGTLVLFYKFN